LRVAREAAALTEGFALSVFLHRPWRVKAPGGDQLVHQIIMIPTVVQRASPIVAATAVVGTLITCVAITKAKDIYVGGLHWPYFSDMGRDPPAYYVFCVGLCIAAVALAMTWIFNQQYQSRVLGRLVSSAQLSGGVRRVSVTCCVLAVLSTIGLPILSICSTSECPSVHNLAAYWFFLLETIAILMNTYVSYKIRSKVSATSPDFVGVQEAGSDMAMVKGTVNASAKRTFHIQAVFTVFFFVAFMIYLPVGLAVIEPFKRLTIAQCLSKDLGREYCTDTMRYNETDTKLWNYEDDFAMNQMRAGAQLACILTLIGYSVSFLSNGDNYDQEHDEPSYHSTTRTEAARRGTSRTDGERAEFSPRSTRVAHHRRNIGSVCIDITRSNHIYVGGLQWPYFSDVGRGISLRLGTDPPAYYVFCIGLCLTAVTLAVTWVHNQQYQSRKLDALVKAGQLSVAVRRISTAACILAVHSTIALPVLSICSTAQCPTVHNLAAYWFFLFQTVAVLINVRHMKDLLLDNVQSDFSQYQTYVSFKIYSKSTVSVASPDLNEVIKGPEMAEKAYNTSAIKRKTWFIQRVLASVFFIAVVLYFPVGLAVIQPFQRLTIDECISKDLGQAYCTDTMRLNDTDTKLWNYEHDLAMNQMRAGAQLACILTLVGYSISFLSNDDDREKVSASGLHVAAPVSLRGTTMISKTVQRASPIVAATAVVVTLITCVAIAKAKNIYVGGLQWPYFSDMGRGTNTALMLRFWAMRRPASILCVLCRPVHCGSRVGNDMDLQPAVSATRIGWACSHCMCTARVDGMLCGGCVVDDRPPYSGTHMCIGASNMKLTRMTTLPVHLQYCRVPDRAQPRRVLLFPLGDARNPCECTECSRSAANVVMSDWSNVVMAAIIDQTYVSYKIRASVAASSPMNATAKRTFLIQAVFTALFSVAFAIYLPVGLSVIKPFKRLTIEQVNSYTLVQTSAMCLSKDLGNKYCTDTMRYNDTDTKLWNYEDDFAMNQMRAAAQLACILTLIGYSVSFLSNDKDDQVHGE
ncbi:TPA: LOW QUALITY PROTEIN: hypothetical protein N0F65_006007, partial [Lagenidium giganteum]